MTNLAPFASQIQVEETQFRAAVSESVMQRMGGVINYILTFAAVNGSTSTSSGVFSDNSGTTVIVPNLTNTITTIGRPVLLSIQPDGSTNLGSFTISNHDANTSFPVMYIYRGATLIASYAFEIGAGGFVIPNGFFFIDVPLAGTYTYTVYINSYFTDCFFEIDYMSLATYQL